MTTPPTDKLLESISRMEILESNLSELWDYLEWTRLDIIDAVRELKSIQNRIHTDIQQLQEGR